LDNCGEKGVELNQKEQKTPLTIVETKDNTINAVIDITEKEKNKLGFTKTPTNKRNLDK
jgi:hypothetical protein